MRPNPSVRVTFTVHTSVWNWTGDRREDTAEHRMTRVCGAQVVVIAFDRRVHAADTFNTFLSCTLITIITVYRFTIALTGNWVARIFGANIAVVTINVNSVAANTWLTATNFALHIRGAVDHFVDTPSINTNIFCAQIVVITVNRHKVTVSSLDIAYVMSTQIAVIACWSPDAFSSGLVAAVIGTWVAVITRVHGVYAASSIISVHTVDKVAQWGLITVRVLHAFLTWNYWIVFATIYRVTIVFCTWIAVITAQWNPETSSSGWLTEVLSTWVSIGAVFRGEFA